MNDEHAHGHGGHTHGVSADTDLRWLTVALAINAAFMLVEIAAGVIASSLALLTDAAHMLTDVGAIGLALFAAHLARRSPKGAMTYGFGRMEILSAQANGLTLIILSGFIIYEGVHRLASPRHVGASLMLAVGLAGIVVNLAAALALAKASRESLKVEGALRSRTRRPSVHPGARGPAGGCHDRSSKTPRQAACCSPGGLPCARHQFARYDVQPTAGCVEVKHLPVRLHARPT